MLPTPPPGTQSDRGTEDALVPQDKAPQGNPGSSVGPTHTQNSHFLTRQTRTTLSEDAEEGRSV